jgi:DNA-binding protein HU-beta
MNNQELIDTVAAATEATGARIDAATTAVASGATVQVIGFGSFSSGEHAPRVGRSAASSKAIQIPVAKTASKVFTQTVNAS